MKSCFFIGHREASTEVLPSLMEAVQVHIEKYGVTEFIVGNHGGFDRMAARTVVLAKEKYPQIMLTLLIPYHPAERRVELPQGFDNSFYPPGMETVPRRLAILRANRYMVERADHLIAYVWHPGSNARNLVEYARSRENLIITLIDRK